MSVRTAEVFFEAGFRLEGRQLEQLEMYQHLLLSWNEKMNLTAITDEEGVLYKHFLDSASLVHTGWIKENASILDVGSGAGFPGIVLKILRPDLEIVLLDATAKRVSFLQEVIRETGLKGIRAIHGRAEDLAFLPEFREQFDVVTSRAVANLSILSEISIPFLKIDGFFLPMKGIQYETEINEAKEAIKILGAKYVDVYSYNLLDQVRYVLKIKKFSKTGKKFPRKYGMMKKKPL